MLTYRKEFDKRHVQHAPAVCLFKEGCFEIARDIVILAAGCNSHRADGGASFDLRAGYLQHFRHAHLAVRNTLAQKRSI